MAYQEQQFNEEITQLIAQFEAVAAVCTSIKEGELGGAWIIMSKSGMEMISNKIYHKAWNDNSSVAAEAAILLKLITVIGKKSKEI